MKNIQIFLILLFLDFTLYIIINLGSWREPIFKFALLIRIITTTIVFAIGILYLKSYLSSFLSRYKALGISLTLIYCFCFAIILLLAQKKIELDNISLWEYTLEFHTSFNGFVRISLPYILSASTTYLLFKKNDTDSKPRVKDSCG